MQLGESAPGATPIWKSWPSWACRRALPKLILFFLRFLGVAGIARDRIYCRLSIHESADVAGAEKFWRQLTALPDDQFRRPTLKRHNPKTSRKNTGDNYHGCLIIRVLGGSGLYRQIEGWASAVMAEPTLTTS
jgi:hypothetical protein